MIQDLLQTMYDTNFQDTFEFREPSYWAMIILWGILMTLVVVFRGKLRDWKHEKTLRYTLAGLLIAGLVSEQIWQIHKGWTLETSLPLSLCSISAFVTIYMLIKKSPKAFDIVFFTGIMGATWAMFFADIKYDFPHVTFFNYFIKHIIITIVPIYMMLVHQFKPSTDAFRRLAVFLGSMLPFVLLLNLYTGGNYWFIMYPVDKLPFTHTLPEFPMRLIVCAVGFMLYSFVGLKIYRYFAEKKELEVDNQDVNEKQVVA